MNYKAIIAVAIIAACVMMTGCISENTSAPSADAPNGVAPQSPDSARVSIDTTPSGATVIVENVGHVAGSFAVGIACYDADNVKTGQITAFIPIIASGEKGKDNVIFPQDTDTFQITGVSFTGKNTGTNAVYFTQVKSDAAKEQATKQAIVDKTETTITIKTVHVDSLSRATVDGEYAGMISDTQPVRATVKAGEHKVSITNVGSATVNAVEHQNTVVDIDGTPYSNRAGTSMVQQYAGKGKEV